jgi:hypothetical protein
MKGRLTLWWNRKHSFIHSFIPEGEVGDKGEADPSVESRTFIHSFFHSFQKEKQVMNGRLTLRWNHEHSFIHSFQREKRVTKGSLTPW